MLRRLPLQMLADGRHRFGGCPRGGGRGPLSDDLLKLPDTLRLARATVRTAHQCRHLARPELAFLAMAVSGVATLWWPCLLTRAPRSSSSRKRAAAVASALIIQPRADHPFRQRRSGRSRMCQSLPDGRGRPSRTADPCRTAGSTTPRASASFPVVPGGAAQPLLGVSGGDWWIGWPRLRG